MLVLRVTCAGLERFKETICSTLADRLAPRVIYERSDGRARRDEGLSPSVGALRGELPSGPVEVDEGGLSYRIDIERGQKTGFYIDQRDSRLRLRGLASGRRVLDLFCYTGGFAMNALKAGAARVVAVDRQQAALDTLEAQVQTNGLDAERLTTHCGDAFDYLRETRDVFDAIVIDPPPFARRKSEVNGACRGYKELLSSALTASSVGGLLMISSCSHHISAWLFQQKFIGFQWQVANLPHRLSRSFAYLVHPQNCCNT